MKELLTEDDLRSFIRETQEYVIQLLFAIGRSTIDDEKFCPAPIYDGINQYTLSLRWFRGHGNSLNLVAEASHGTNPAIEIRGSTVGAFGKIMGRDQLQVLSMSQAGKYSWDAQLQVATTIEAFFKAMLPRARWRNRYGICQSSFHEFNGSDSYLLTEWAGKQLCDDCAKVLSLTETVYHRTGEDEKERSERDKMTSRLRWEILERDRFTCNSCGRSAPDVRLHVDHKIPVALGGKTVPDNLHTLCAECNLGKSAKMPTQATLQFWEQVAA